MFIKRAMDVVVALPALIIFLPLIVLIGGIIRLAMGSPVLFKQRRPGLNGNPFMLKKFRTMSNDRTKSGRLLPDGERLTRLGKFLRKTSLDELPQLWNVLAGDMSLVGPRPLLMRYLGRYDRVQMRRHEVKPGLTGWAQVNGRNAVSWEQKFALDVWYVDNRSILLDLRILFLTLGKVFSGQGVSQEGAATADEFLGPAEKKGHNLGSS